MAPAGRLSRAVSTAAGIASAFSLARAARVAGLALGLTLYVALGTAATVIFPPLGALFLVPIAIAIIAVAPAAKAAPRRLAMSLLTAAAFLLPLWPAYLFVAVGPLPALIPPRIVLYLVSALWAYDMTFSPFRRAQFAIAVKKSGAVSGLFFALFALGFLSLPFSEGRSIAIPEFFRQSSIWLVPYCAILTYCRRQRDFALLMKALVLGAVPVALIALTEAATHQLLANLLSPFIADDAEWLRNVQSFKIRDGVFRAQATHTHPLSLGEHMAFMAPVAFGFAIAARNLRARALWASAFAAIAMAAIATNSRGAVIVIVLGVGVMTGLLVWRALKRVSASRWRPLAGLAFMAAVAISPLTAVSVYGSISGKSGVSAANSTQSRLDQIEMAWPKIMKRPVGGYGSGRSARVLGYWGRTLTLDNYYLSLALDLGFPGPIAFFAMLAAWALAALRRSSRAHPSLGALYLAMFGSVLSIAIGRTIISQTGNLAIIYFMMAAFAGASVTFSRRRLRNRTGRSAVMI